MHRFKDDCTHFIFNKRPIYTHDGASYKFTTNSHKTDNSEAKLLNIDYCSVCQGLQNLSVNCFLDAAVGALRDRCDGLTSCQVAADTFRLAPADPCPAHARYLEAHYVCNSRTGSIH
jgi:hypothetical protein